MGFHSVRLLSILWALISCDSFNLNRPDSHIALTTQYVQLLRFSNAIRRIITQFVLALCSFFNFFFSSLFSHLLFSFMRCAIELTNLFYVNSNDIIACKALMAIFTITHMLCAVNKQQHRTHKCKCKCKHTHRPVCHSSFDAMLCSAVLCCAVLRWGQAALCGATTPRTQCKQAKLNRNYDTMQLGIICREKAQEKWM